MMRLKTVKYETGNRILFSCVSKQIRVNVCIQTKRQPAMFVYTSTARTRITALLSAFKRYHFAGTSVRVSLVFE